MSLAPDTIAANLAAVRARIAAAVARRGPGREPILIGVSKKQPAESVIAACRAGLVDFGENYAQELAAKAEVVHAAVRPRWHFIGPLQSNKVGTVVALGAVLHTVDRPSLLTALAKELRKHHGPAGGPPFEVLVEVNVGGEAQKAGVLESGLPALLDRFADHPELRCIGLMAIPPAEDDPERTRPQFARLRELLRREAAVARPNVVLTHLSMGMSSDFEVAIEEGSTMVRVGTAIFGART